MVEEADPFEHTRMTLGEHLEELRRRLMIGLGSIIVLFFVAFAFKDRAMRVALQPYDVMVAKLERFYVAEAEEALKADPSIPREKYFVWDGQRERLRSLQDTRMTSVAPGETFFFQLKICIYISLFIGSPILLWQLWMFVGAGLYRREKRAVLRFFPTAAVLFMVGVLFGYFILVPYAMYFLNRSTPLDLVRPDFRVQEYFSFLSSLCLGLGVAFQLPIAMLVLTRLDIVTPAMFAKYRGHTWVIVMIVAGILTPPDPYTQSMMALPMLLLYEVGILWARMSEKARL
jgi:sec-independent protein translocase protein TatC